METTSNPRYLPVKSEQDASVHFQSSAASDPVDVINEETQWASAGQKIAAVNYSEKVLEEKERRLVENIQRNYGRIKQVEAELAALQLQLRMNVGPKKHALEMLRRKIEVHNEHVRAATLRRDVAKKAYDEASEVLAAEERAKEQLCQELNMLVQQSASAQLDKLDQLTRRLELLNSGISMAEEATHMAERDEPARPAASVHQGAGALRSQVMAAPNGAAAAVPGVPALDPSNPFLAVPPAGACDQGPGAAGAVPPQLPPQEPTPEEAAAQRQRAQEAAEQAERARRQAEEERRRRQAQAEAEAARSRHVSIGRPAGAGRAASHKQQQQGRPRTVVHVAAAREGDVAAAAQPRIATDERGPFRGFE